MPSVAIGISARISLIRRPHTPVSHGRGHWFDPSTAHHLEQELRAIATVAAYGRYEDLGFERHVCVARHQRPWFLRTESRLRGRYQAHCATTPRTRRLKKRRKEKGPAGSSAGRPRSINADLTAGSRSRRRRPPARRPSRSECPAPSPHPSPVRSGAWNRPRSSGRTSAWSAGCCRAH